MVLRPRQRKGKEVERKRKEWNGYRLAKYLTMFIFAQGFAVISNMICIFFYWIRSIFQSLSDGIGFVLKTLRNWKGNALASRFYFWIISCNCCISLNMKIYISRSLILLYQNRLDVLLLNNEQYNCIIFSIMWIKTLKNLCRITVKHPY